MELTELKLKYVTILDVHTRSNQTKKQYYSCINKFCKENARVYRLSKEQLIEYLALFRTRYSDSYYNVMGSALKLFYKEVLNQPNKMNWFKAIKSKPVYHDIMKDHEFISMMKNCGNIKHKLIVILLYSTGIRVGELVDIKLSDIDLTNNCIFINSLKGGKNRNVSIQPLTMKYLKVYLKEYNPEEYLLNGQFDLKYSIGSVQKIVKKVSNGKYTPHDFRHLFATKTIEKENVFAVQELLGHRSLNSTIHYNHIPKDKLNTMYNPLDAIQHTN